MKIPRGTSESSTTSDNTSEFIDIVKKYDVVYNTHNPDYKNVEVKLKVWSQIAEEIGLSVDASKRKWKNLRDSYTKYLRSFRVGTKTSKKYQYWAHADHMDFLKPYQGPGRNLNNGVAKANEEEENECDLGFQVLAKATSSSSEEDHKQGTDNKSPRLAATTATTTATTTAATTTNNNNTINTNTTTTSNNLHLNGFGMTMPSLPVVSLPQLSGKHAGLMPPMLTATTTATSCTMSPPLSFPSLPSLTNANGNGGTKVMPPSLPMPSCSTASSVGCLIIEPHLLANAAAAAAAADNLKKEFNASMANFGLFQASTTNSPCHVTTTTPAAPRSNPPLITKIRRVQQPPPPNAAKDSPTQGAINLSFSATNSNSKSNPATGQPVHKARKLSSSAYAEPRDIDVSAVLHANRDLDANTLFFLSLARQVRSMPTKLQSLAKMRCMRIVSDIELELESMDCNSQNGNGQNSPSGSGAVGGEGGPGGSEHFIYVMSPSRVESMIDISSDDEGASMPN